MKRVLLIVGLAVATIVAAGLIWFFGINQKPEGSVEPGPSSGMESAPTETLTMVEATELAGRLVSQDEAIYATAWSHDNIPPVSPEGTTIVANAVESGEGVAVIDVTFMTSGAETDYYLLVQFVDNSWRIYSMEAK